MSDDISIRPLTPTIGAEVLGVDLRTRLEDRTVATIGGALATHGVLFFRDQDLTVERQKAFGARFGELLIHPNDPGLEGHPEVMVIHADEASVRVAGEMWHSDVSCDPEPPMGSILRMHTVPEQGGDTLFACMYAAYEALSEPMKTLLVDIRALHDGGPYYREANALRGRPAEERAYPRAEHPVVRVHPLTGRPALFVNSMFTTRLLGLPKPESDALLDFLFQHVKRPEFHCRFRWRANSIAFWDNRSTQHHAIWDYSPHTRSGYRVTIRGERPV